MKDIKLIVADLERFVETQESKWAGYAQALEEMKSGGKRSHWIWYIFPQIAGLGFSGMSQHFGIRGRAEAQAYLQHPALGERLREITKVVLSYPDGADPDVFMMTPIDAMKLQSSMTLFDAVSPNDIFGQVLAKFFGGQRDEKTIRILGKEGHGKVKKDMKDIKGSIYGAVAGDISGSLYEFVGEKTKDFELFPYWAKFTDDTVMTLAIARWFLDDEGLTENALIDSMCELGNRYPAAGYGGNFSWWLRHDPTPYNSWGNGSAMRVSSVGLWAETLDDCLRLAEMTAAVSHNHPEGIKGAQAVAASMFIARHWEGDADGLKRQIKDYVTATFGYNLDRTLAEIRPTYSFDVSCQGSVPEAIIAFLEATDYEDAIRNAISLGGDADTQGAITGAIAACVWPIPENILQECKKRLTPDLLEIAERFEMRR